MSTITAAQVLETDRSLFAEAKTHAPGPQGSLPITAEMLLTAPSGNLFGLTQNAGMGWEPARLLDPEFLILSTHGGLRAQDGTPIALGFHSGTLGGRSADGGGPRANCAICTLCRLPAPARIHVMAALRVPRACSTRSLTATTPQSCCAA